MANQHTREMYRDTVNLPSTAFPMRANLPEREQETLEYWRRIDLYRSAQERTAGRPKFILHDGPPFSNGDIHLGHALNKILKDFVVKFRSMQGYDAPFVPGWDAHGLPTEIKAVRTFSLDRHAIDPLDLRRRCEETSRKYIDLQRRQFQRLGVRGDWDRPYLTMQPAYEAAVLGAFARLVAAGRVYRGFKPVYWCTSCETALAEAEVEFREHEAPSIYVAFPVVRLPEGVFPEADPARMAVVIWTTTPWTLPANVAVAVHPESNYVLVRERAQGAAMAFLVAREALARFATATGIDIEAILGEVPGRALAGTIVQHPFLPREVPVVLAEYVTVEEGTGLVHVAPGHGREDFQTGVTYGLPTIHPVGPAGWYGPEAGPFAGQPIYEAQEKILERLDADGTLLAYDTILHQYPHCWRCREPIIIRTTEQWFLAVHQYTEASLAAVAEVQWLPAWGRERMTHMLRDRPDWCLSRQRAWGTPIPAFYCEHCGEALLSLDAITHLQQLVREEGSVAWLRHPASALLPVGTACTRCGGMTFRKETDIFDVWFDSGCSHLAVLEQRQELARPADLYLEGHDQYRGWFQVSLLTSVGIGDAPPYRAALAHGFTLDQTGQKQAKSLGNIINPQDVVRKYGADILRLWVASSDIRADLVMSEEVFRQVVEVYRRLRNTLRFLLGNLYDFTPAMARPVADLAEIDRWALGRLNGVIQQVTTACETYEFHRAYHALNAFCATDLSGFYLDVAKDWLYTALPDAPARRATQTVFYYLAEILARLLAPLASFTADEVWQYLPGTRADSAQLTDWPRMQAAWVDEALAAKWAHVLAIREMVQGALTTARAQGIISQPLAANVTLYLAGETYRLLESLRDDLAKVLIVSQAHVEPWEAAPSEAYRGAWPQVAMRVTAASGTQCPRCRLWRVVGGHAAHPALCVDCATTVAARPRTVRASGE